MFCGDPVTQMHRFLALWVQKGKSVLPFSDYNTVVSRKYAPPFATLALVQSAGGAYTRDATFSLAITPSLDREI